MAFRHHNRSQRRQADPDTTGRRRFRGDNGDVGPWTVMTPIAVGVVMFVLQIGITYHAKSVVIAAAQDGARAAQTETGTTNDARHVIEMLLGDEGLLETTSVDVSRTDDHVSVQITAEVTSLVPFWNPTVTGAAEGPTERFRSEPER